MDNNNKIQSTSVVEEIEVSKVKVAEPIKQTKKTFILE